MTDITLSDILDILEESDYSKIYNQRLKINISLSKLYNTGTIDLISHNIISTKYPFIVNVWDNISRECRNIAIQNMPWDILDSLIEKYILSKFTTSDILRRFNCCDNFTYHNFFTLVTMCSRINSDYENEYINTLIKVMSNIDNFTIYCGIGAEIMCSTLNVLGGRVSSRTTIIRKRPTKLLETQVVELIYLYDTCTNKNNKKYIIILKNIGLEVTSPERFMIE